MNFTPVHPVRDGEIIGNSVLSAASLRGRFEMIPDLRTLSFEEFAAEFLNVKFSIGSDRFSMLVVDDMPADTLLLASSRENAVIGTNIGKGK